MNFGAEVFDQGSGEGSGEGLGGFKSSQVIQVVKLNRVADKVPEKVLEEIPAEFWCSQVMFNRVPEKVPREGLGGFGAEPGYLQLQFCSIRVSVTVSVTVITRFRRRLKVPGNVCEALVQRQVRFNRVREKVLEAAFVQSQISFNGLPKNFPQKVPEKGIGSFGAEPGQV